MKNITLITLALCLATSLSSVAQVWYSEDFEGVTAPALPSNATSVDSDGDGHEWFSFDASGQDPWTANGTIAGSASFDNTDGALTPDNLLIIGPVDLSASTGTPSMTLMWNVGATEATSTGWHQEHYSVYVETSTTPGTALFSETLADGQVLYNRSTDISSFAGNSSVYLIFRHHNCSDEFRLGIDNIEVKTVSDDDAGVSDITMNTVDMLSSGAQTITGEITNYGANAITSLNVIWSVNGGAPTTETLSALNIPSFGTYNFTLAGTWTPPATGSYTIAISTSNPNGNTDAVASNDLSTLDISIVDQFVTRLPLYENFTSSTCPPCVPANAQMLSLFGKDPEAGPNAGKWSLVKYQMSWPGNGDPYFTNEGNTRRNYYGVSSVPNLWIDGGWGQNGNSLTQTVIDDFASPPAFLDIQATYTISGQTVSIDVILNPVADVVSLQSSNLVLHMAIVEDETYANVETNGETEFQFVMKKMVPGAGGTPVGPFTSGTPVAISDGYTFNGSYTLPPDANSPANLAVEHTVEEFTDLSVVVWVQDVTTKEVHQSAWAVYSCGSASATSVDASCGAADGSATATSTGGGTIYQWDDAGAQTTAIATGLAAGSYSCTITDAIGCSVSTTVFVNNIGGATVTAASIPNTCADGSTGAVNLTTSGGTGPYTYLWSNGATTENITGCIAGDYTVTITDASGCLTFRTATVTAPDAISASSSVTASTGSNGAINLTVSGGTPNYNYSWDNGETTQNLTGLAPGTYMVTITDGFGCTLMESVTVPAITAIEQLVTHLTVLNIYPNPFSHSATIEFTLSGPEQVSVHVMNVVGELVYTEQHGSLGSGSHKIKVAGEGLVPGIYFVKIQFGESAVTRKVIHH